MLLGGEKIAADFETAVRAGRTTHAYLLTGGEGSGKKTFAAFMARALLCPDGGCGRCDICRKVQSEHHPDVIRVRGQGRDGLIPVDQVRALRRDVYTLPNEGSKKIYIIEQAEKMNVQGQDAFLKVLEEPPGYAVFILLCTDERAMLQTVLSRVMRISMPVPPEAAAEALLVQRTGCAPAAVRTAFRICDGRIGAAEALLKEDLPQKQQRLEQFLQTLTLGTSYQLAAMIHAVAADRGKLDDFLGLLEMYLRDILVYKKTSDRTLVRFEDSVVQNAGRLLRLGAREITALIDEIRSLRRLCGGPYSLLLLETEFAVACARTFGR